jgi:hypothetical protein
MERCSSKEAQQVQEAVRTVQADIERVRDLFEPASFDVVLCHGVLMYVDDPADVIAACEERAGRTDPYRRVAPLYHIMAESNVDRGQVERR